MVLPFNYLSYIVKKIFKGYFLKSYIEERAMEIASYIIENNCTVRQAAKQYGISKSTVHAVVTIENDTKAKSYGELNRTETRALSG